MIRSDIVFPTCKKDLDDIDVMTYYYLMNIYCISKTY